MTDSIDPHGGRDGPPAPSASIRVLLVEDNEDDALLVLRQLRRAGYAVETRRVDTAPELAEALRESWDVILSDFRMPEFDGLEALGMVRRRDPEIPFIIVSGVIGETAAVGAMKAGAHDYLRKDDLVRLVPVVERELREAAGRRSRRAAEQARREEAEISASLARAGHELLASIDVPSIVRTLARLGRDLLGSNREHVFLRDPGTTLFVAIGGSDNGGAAGARPDTKTVPRERLEPLLERLRSEEVLWGSALPGVEHLLGRGDGFALVAALRRGAEVFGLYVAGFNDANQLLDGRRERIARGVAQLASLALDNARLLEELARANQLKSEFVATMSHELRTPLNVITGYIDLLVGGEFGPLSQEQSEIVKRADRSAHELLDLINATLDLSRLDAGRLPLDVRDVELASLFAELRRDSQRWMQRKPSLQLLWKVDADVPVVRCDVVKLKVVLKNLIDNAIKYTDQGEVRVEGRAADEGVEVAISDTGEGISEELRGALFSIFPHGPSSTGRGLGLYIVRRLLDVLGGSIAVESEAGRGSTFRVRLPALPPGNAAS